MATRELTGMVGYKRRVSLQTALRYGRDSRRVAMSNLGSERAFGDGMAVWSSVRRRVWIWGLVARRCVAHVSAEDVVSCLYFFSTHKEE